MLSLKINREFNGTPESPAGFPRWPFLLAKKITPATFLEFALEAKEIQLKTCLWSCRGPDGVT